MCCGVCCVDQLLKLETFPRPDGYAVIREEAVEVGGEATATAVALARWGLEVKLAANEVGEDGYAEFIKQRLNRVKGLEVELKKVTGRVTPHAVILCTPPGKRTILGWFPDLKLQAPAEAEFKGVDLVVVDRYFGEATYESLKRGQEAGARVVGADLLPGQVEVRFCEAVVNSANFLGGAEGLSEDEAKAACVALSEAGVKWAVVTQGEGGAWACDEKGRLFHRAAEEVEVVDTTGAGDVFRAGLAFGLAKGWGLEAAVELGTLAAAEVCTGYGGTGRTLALEAACRRSQLLRQYCH